MPLGWIDFSKSERNKVMNVIHLLSAEEQGVVDELGIGAVRDAFADLFFPGTSTVQTRAKYFLIVPYVLMEAGTGQYGSEPNAILRRINDEERKCRDILIQESTDGVIGSLVPESWVIRAPSNIYWNGIRRFGIFKADLSVKEYFRGLDMPKIVQKKKGPFGETVYVDENFHLIGTSRKGLLGEEVFLDRDLHFAGTKKTGIMEEDIYLDQDQHLAGFGMKGPGNNKILMDKNGHYVGFSGKGPGDQEIAFLDNATSPEQEKTSVGALVALGILLIAVILLMLLILK